MKRSDRLMGWLAAMTLAGTVAPAWADADPSRYTAIVDRNPFGLKPPPPPPDPASLVPPPPPAQLATVELTGITSILSSKRALLEIIPGPGKPMLKPILAEGEKVESVEVVSIDIDKNQVIIKNGSLVTNLTFKVVKAGPTTPPPGGVIPGIVPGVVPPNLPPGSPQAAYNYSQPNSTRSGVIMTGGTPAVDPAAAAAAGNPAGFRSIPTRSIRSGLPQSPVANAPMTPEASVIDIERNRQVNPSHFPPLPPTVLSPHLTPQLPPLPGQ